MCHPGRRTYFCDWQAPQQARGFCTDLLTDTIGYSPHAQRVIDDAKLIVSELITNAVNARCATVDLYLELHRDHLRIAVTDDAAGRPELQHAADDDVHGRGLAIIDGTASTWGVTYSATGKQLWATVAVPRQLTTTIECSTQPA